MNKRTFFIDFVTKLTGHRCLASAGKMKSSEKRKNKARRSLTSVSVSSTSKTASQLAITVPAEQTDRKNVLIDNMHDHLESDPDAVKVSLMDEDFPLLPITPSKSPASKQRRVEDTATATAILSELSSLSRLINSRGKDGQ